MKILQLTIILVFTTAYLFSQEVVSGDCKNGKGIYKYSEGTVYEGTWKDGMRHGFGKMTYADGMNEGKLPNKQKLEEKEEGMIAATSNPVTGVSEQGLQPYEKNGQGWPNQLLAEEDQKEGLKKVEIPDFELPEVEKMPEVPATMDITLADILLDNENVLQVTSVNKTKATKGEAELESIPETGLVSDENIEIDERTEEEKLTITNTSFFPKANVLLKVNGAEVASNGAFQVETGNAVVAEAKYNKGLYIMAPTKKVKWRLLSEDIRYESSPDVQITSSAQTKGQARIDLPKSGVQETYLVVTATTNWRFETIKEDGSIFEQDVEHVAKNEFTIQVNNASISPVAASYIHFDYSGHYDMHIDSRLKELDHYSKQIGQELMAGNEEKASFYTGEYIALLNGVNDALAQKNDGKTVHIKSLPSTQAFNIITDLKTIDKNLAENRTLVVKLQQMTQQILKGEHKFEIAVLVKLFNAYLSWGTPLLLSGQDVAVEFSKTGMEIFLSEAASSVGSTALDLVLLPQKVEGWAKAAEFDANQIKSKFTEIKEWKEVEDMTYQAITDVIAKRKKTQALIDKWMPAEQVHLRLLVEIAKMPQITM